MLCYYKVAISYTATCPCSSYYPASPKSPVKLAAWYMFFFLISRCIASHSCPPCTLLLNPSGRTPPTPYGIHQAHAPAPRHSLLLPLVLPFPLTTLPLLLHLFPLLSQLLTTSCPAQALPNLPPRSPYLLPPSTPPSSCLSRKRTRRTLASWPTV
jgi:hypothetical protein